MIHATEISQAIKEDATEILAVQHAAFLSEALIYNNYHLEPLTQTLASVENDFFIHTYIKAVANEQIVGSIKARYTEDKRCWLGRLSVHPDFQHQGIGKRLMLAVEDYFPEAIHYYLCTGHLSTNNIAMYQSIGYHIFGNLLNTEFKEVKLVQMIKPNTKLKEV